MMWMPPPFSSILSYFFLIAIVFTSVTGSLYEELREANLGFSLELLRGLSVRAKPRESLVFSPFSIYQVLLMAHLGAKGNTAQEILRTLKLSKMNEMYIHETFGKMVQDLVNDPSVTGSLAVANRLFVEESLRVIPNYEVALKRYYQSDLERISFLSGTAGNTINRWVDKQTHGKIGDFLARSPSPSTKLMMINALYFSGEWLWQFDRTQTDPYARFYTSPLAFVSTPMMVGKMMLAYGRSESMKCSILELPFKSHRLSMFIVLPDQIEGLDPLVRTMNVSSVHHLISVMKKSEVNVRIPRFTIQSNPLVTEALRDMGLHELFSWEDARLDGVSPAERIHVGDLVHRATITADERGSIAAAATAAVVERIGSFTGNFFEADHPFMFFIMDKQSGMVLFLGRFLGK